jgi:hypothetical protein
MLLSSLISTMGECRNVSYIIAMPIRIFQDLSPVLPSYHVPVGSSTRPNITLHLRIGVPIPGPEGKVNSGWQIDQRLGHIGEAVYPSIPTMDIHEMDLGAPGEAEFQPLETLQAAKDTAHVLPRLEPRSVNPSSPRVEYKIPVSKPHPGNLERHDGIETGLWCQGEKAV